MPGLVTTDWNAVRDYHAEHGSEIMTTIMEEAGELNGFTHIEFKDRFEHSIGESTEIVQSYQKAWTPKGTVSLKPRIQRHEAWKGDVEFAPRDHSTRAWEAHMARVGSDPYDLPYAAFIIEQLFRQIMEDITASMLWNGVYAGPTIGVSNNAQDVADGFLAYIAASVTASEIVPYATGALTNANAYSVIEDFVKAKLNTPTKRRQPFTLYCSQDILDMYQTSYRDNVGTYIHANDFNHVRIQGANVTIMPQAGLLGSQKLVLAQPKNMFIGYDGMTSFKVEEAKRELCFLIDGEFSVQYAIPQEVFVNDQA